MEPPTVAKEVAVVLRAVQLLMLICSGAMKSLSSAVKESDERLLTKAEPSAPHWPGCKVGKRASNEIAASPKVSESSAPKPPLLVAPIAEELIEPIAPPDAVRSVGAPHADPPHVRIEIS